MIKISIEHRHEVQVHNDLVVNHSPQIKRLAETAEEEYEGEFLNIALSEEDITESCWTLHHAQEMLNGYVSWLYNGKIASNPPKRRYIMFNPNSSKGDGYEYRRLFDMYSLAVFLQDARFQDSILDAFVARNHEAKFIDAEGAVWIVEQCYKVPGLRGSKLQDLLVTIFSIDATQEDLCVDGIKNGKAAWATFRYDKEAKTAFLTDVASKLLQRQIDMSVEETVTELLKANNRPDESTASHFHLCGRRDELSCRIAKDEAPGEKPRKKRKRQPFYDCGQEFPETM